MRINMINRRKQLGLTQEEVANEINRSRNTYTSYERGVINPPLEVVLKLKNVLRTNDDDIFLNTDVIVNDNIIEIQK